MSWNEIDRTPCGQSIAHPRLIHRHASTASTPDSLHRELLVVEETLPEEETSEVQNKDWKAVHEPLPTVKTCSNLNDFLFGDDIFVLI